MVWGNHAKKPLQLFYHVILFIILVYSSNFLICGRRPMVLQKRSIHNVGLTPRHP